MRRKIRIAGVITTFALALSCSPNETKNSESELQRKPVNKIVVIIKGAPVTNKVRNKTGGTLGRGIGIIRWFDDNLITHEYTPETYPAFDTLTINTKQRNFELIHTYRGVDEISYILENGDSVILDYRDSIPIASVVNRKVLPADLNYELIKRQVVCNGGYPANMRSAVLSTLFSSKPEQPILSSGNSSSILLNFQKTIFAEHELEKKREKKLLDSLLANGQLSTRNYSFYHEKLKFSDYEIIFYPVDSIKSFLQQDSLLVYNFYRKYLTKVLYNKSISPPVPKIRTANGIFPDARIAYDSLAANENFSGKTKDYLLFSKVSAIIRDFSAQDISTYMGKFEKDVTDTSMVNYLRRTYKISGALEKELRLRSITGEVTTLSNVLSEFKGKVVYVDFWASWCAPCIREFPAVKSLKQEYKDKAIVFLLLSRDEEEGKWKKAIGKYELGSGNNYIIENNHSSKFLDDIKLSSIPRYLLIGKDGSIVSMTAPEPSDPAIKNIFDLALKK